MRKKHFPLVALLSFTPILFLGVLFWWKDGLSPRDPSNKEKISFVVKRGDGISKIASGLKENGLIKDSFRFRILVSFSKLSGKLQAGSFFLSPSMTPLQIAIALTKGANDQWSTIIEGLREEQIREQLLSDGFPLDSSLWEKEVRGNKLEGKLFPDSYLFPNRATEGAILKIISRNFLKKVVDGLQKELTQSDLSLNQVLTLASIVERESKDNPDRLIVAGILKKRLESDWALQADATVQYAVGSKNCGLVVESGPAYGRDKSGSGGEKCEWWPQKLTSTDVKINSSYNTYVNHGLPPGPICNPGLSAIKAVLNPKDSNYWFYLTGNDGKMHYATTSQEHAENIRLYLLKD